MQTTLSQFTETTSTDAFALQNDRLLEVRLQEGTIQAKQGGMVAYQGEVDRLTVNARNILAFDSDIDWYIERVKGAGCVDADVRRRRPRSRGPRA